MINKEDFKIIEGDCLQTLKMLPDQSVQCCITSPPYYGLRDYGTAKWVGGDPNCPHYRTNKIGENCSTGHKNMSEEMQPVGDAIYKTVCPLCGAIRVDEQIGLEESPEEYVDKLVEVFREVRRVLKDDGTLWLNLGDSYSSFNNNGLKQKDLMGIPWVVAFALRNDGWYLRQDIIWCLSGGVWLYAKTQKGVMPMTVKDIKRLASGSVQLWDGNKWVAVTNIQENTLYNSKIEIVLRSGERMGCTDGHRWILKNGEQKIASELVVGDTLMHVPMPDFEGESPMFLNDDVLWFLGLYVAEGSLSDDCIQIALNADEFEWYEKINGVASYFGGTSTYTINGNNLAVRIYSSVLLAVLHKYIGGTNAKTKHLSNSCWALKNEDLKKILMGYLDGDGHQDGDRIRLGFTRNYELERDLRLAASRLGASLTLTPTMATCGDKSFPSFRGEWRWDTSNHWNCKDRFEIVEIRKSRARHFYDITVDSDEHTFALASGVLTHNCKPNPMPESVKDRCTKSHEYIFLLSKSPKYYFDYEAIQEEATGYDGRKDILLKGSPKYAGQPVVPNTGEQSMANGGHERWKFKNLKYDGQRPNTMHELRAIGKADKVYTKTVPTKIAFGGNKYGDNNDSHFQTYSGNNWEQKVVVGEDGVEVPIRNKRDVWSVATKPYSGAHFATYPLDLIEPCVLAGSNVGDTILDPFNGSGTTGICALMHGRKYIGLELNPKYAKLSYDRFDEVFNGVKPIEDNIDEDNIFEKFNWDIN